MKNIPGYNLESVLEELTSFIEFQGRTVDGNPTIYEKGLSKEIVDKTVSFMKKIFPQAKIDWARTPAFLGDNGEPKICKSRVLYSSSRYEYLSYRKIWIYLCKMEKYLDINSGQETKRLIIRASFNKK